jgi:hypothetical protein
VDAAFEDPLLALAAEKADPSGKSRRLKRDAGRALAAHATLDRLETAPAERSPTRRDRKILHEPAAFERLFVHLFLDAQGSPPEEIVLDLDATDDPVHGEQEGRFFQG